jgi:hypothetical protein
MLEDWRSAGVLEAAKVSLGVDMGFLLAYPFFLRSTVGLLRRRVRAGRLARGGDWLVRAVLLCVPLDLAENLLLWRMVDGGATAWGAGAAAVCAGIKFLLVGAAAGWCLLALVAGGRGRRPAG